MRALFTASRGHCGGLGALETWSRLGDGAGRGGWLARLALWGRSEAAASRPGKGPFQSWRPPETRRPRAAAGRQLAYWA